ncbi:retroelement silencing factor 1 isoform X2 [Paroedura picta]|uniref:retroelement silencing factor 1 isoform X2 n=1 Tax=Paroedura picta TaxID=143630 RepID=UPI0040571BCC
MMDWTVRPLHATSLPARDFQLQGLYQSQQPASEFFQASASAQNSSAYTGNNQAIKMHSGTENMVPNQLSYQSNMGSKNFQPPSVGQHPQLQLSSKTVQMTSGMAKKTWPNSNVHIFFPVAPQISTANLVQRPPNQYITSDIYNNRASKNCSNSVQSSFYWGNRNGSCSTRLPRLVSKNQTANPQTNATVPHNQVSNYLSNSQQNSSCLTFPSGQNIQSQINDINSGSTTAMQSQQYASNSVYSSPYTIPTHYAAQVNPQASNTNLPPPPPYAVPPIQMNHEQFVLPQPVSNTSNENVHHPQNLELNQSNVSYSVKNVQTPESVSVSRETNEGGVSVGMHGYHAENQHSNKLTNTAAETIKSIGNSIQTPGTVPTNKTSASQTAGGMVEDNTPNGSGNIPDSLIKFKESLKMEKIEILAAREKLLQLQGRFKLKHQLYKSVLQKISNPSVRNPDTLLPTSNTSQQPAPLPQATQQTFSLPSSNATRNLTSLLPHENAQNQPPSLLASSSNQIQDSSLLPVEAKNHLYPILQDLLKGTCDEEMLLNVHVASTGRKQSKQLFSQEKCASGSALDSSGGKSETSVNYVEKAFIQNPKTSPAVSTQGSLKSTNVSLNFEQASALGNDQLTNMSAMSGGGFLLNKIVTKILTNHQSTVSVQNPPESSQLSEKFANEGIKKFQNPRSEFIQQSKDNCLQAPDKSNTAWSNGNELPNSASLATTVSEAGTVQRSSFVGNSCTMERTCSLEELETSLALWRKWPTSSLNDQLGVSTKSAVCSSSLNGVEDEKREFTMKNLQGVLSQCEKSGIAVGKNEPTLSSVTSSLGQKVDVVSSSLSRSSEPQVAVVPPLILSKEVNWNEVPEKSLSSMLEKMYPVITEGSVHSLQEFVRTLSGADKLVKRTAYSPSDSCVTVKEIDSDMYQKLANSMEENGIQRGEEGTASSCDPNQGLTGISELETNIPQSRDSFLPGTNTDGSSPLSQKCVPKTSPDWVEPEDTVLNENMLQISSVCTLVQGDACYNSQIANIFNATSSEDQTDTYNKELQLSHWKKESEMNGSKSVDDVKLPSLDTLSKAIAEKLLSLPGLKKLQGGKILDEMNEEEKTAEFVNPNSEKGPEQNIPCHNVQSRDLASGNQEVLGNSIADEGSTYGIQDCVPSNENRVHSVNNSDITLTLPNDQLTELLKEFPYGIDDSKALKKTENEDSTTKVNEMKEGQDSKTCVQNSEGTHALDQIIITILNPQQMKELFPEYSSQPSKKLENDKLTIASENTNESCIRSMIVQNTNTSAETAQKTASHSFCCTTAWLALKYAVDPCEHMLAKEAAFKQQLGQDLPSKIIIKEEHKLLKEDKGLTPCSFSEKLEPLKPKNKEVSQKVHPDELRNQKGTTLLSKRQERLYLGTDDSKGKSACKRELSEKKRTLKETVVDKSKSYTLQHRSMEIKHSKKKEKYKIKRDSSETHIIKGPTYTLKRGLKKHIAREGKQKTDERLCHPVTNSSNFSNVDQFPKAYNSGQHSQEHLNRQKHEIGQDLGNNRAVRTEHSESSNSEPVRQNKGSFARTNLKKFAYPEERGNIWKYRRSLPDNIKTSKVQPFRGQHLNMYKAHFSSKEVVRGARKRDKYFVKSLSDKKSPCNRKSNTLTLQREQKKNYLNKVAFKQTEQSICLTKLEQSPSKCVWHVKSSSASEHCEDKKPQMLEFKMCPEIVFRKLVSEDVADAKKLPEREIIPVSGIL